MELDKHQRYASRLLRRNNGGAVWHRVGEGKTRIAYKWFATIAKRCDVPPIFIAVVRRKAFSDWQAEARKLNLNWNVCDFEIYLGSFTRRTRPLLLLVSHGMLHKLRDELGEYASLVQGICYDEGFLYGNPKTLHTKAANELSCQVGRASILSGSVMTNRNLENIFSQFYAINRHEEAGLGRTLTEFRSRFMVKYQIKPGDNSRFKYVNARRAVDRVATLVAPHSSIWFPKSRRKIRHVCRTVQPSAAQQRAMDLLRKEYYLQTRKGVLELRNAPSLIIKCQQISDGFLKLSEGEIINYSSAKLDYLIEFVSELISCGEKVLIWCAFNYSVDKILQRLQRDLPSIKAYGFTGTRRFDQAGWERDGQVVVATEDCGSSVNHFAQVKHAVYYSMSYKWLSLQQSRGRNDRKDSQHSVAYYYYLYTQGSLDRFVHNTAEKSGVAEKDLIDLTKIKQWLHDSEQ